MKLKVGDTVSWRGAWGRLEAKPVKVIRIEIGCVNKSGYQADEVDWFFVDDTVIVDLNNGHWAYGSQIKPMNIGEDHVESMRTMR